MVFFSSIYLPVPVCPPLDVCRLPTQVPKFEWIKKYKKAINRQEAGKQAGKQAFAALEALSNKNNQHQKIGLSPQFYL